MIKAIVSLSESMFLILLKENTLIYARNLPISTESMEIIVDTLAPFKELEVSIILPQTTLGGSISGTDLKVAESLSKILLTPVNIYQRSLAYFGSHHLFVDSGYRGSVIVAYIKDNQMVNLVETSPTALSRTILDLSEKHEVTEIKTLFDLSDPKVANLSKVENAPELWLALNIILETSPVKRFYSEPPRELPAEKPELVIIKEVPEQVSPLLEEKNPIVSEEKAMRKINLGLSKTKKARESSPNKPERETSTKEKKVRQPINLSIPKISLGTHKKKFFQAGMLALFLLTGTMLVLNVKDVIIPNFFKATSVQPYEVQVAKDSLAYLKSYNNSISRGVKHHSQLISRLNNLGMEIQIHSVEFTKSSMFLSLGVNSEEDAETLAKIMPDWYKDIAIVQNALSTEELTAQQTLSIDITLP